jgi:hypothetical protein
MVKWKGKTNKNVHQQKAEFDDSDRRLSRFGIQPTSSLDRQRPLAAVSEVEAKRE